jgi:hypothetical protein
MMNAEQEKYLDLRGLALYSSLAVPTLRDYMKGMNPIPHYKLRGKVLVKQSDFDRWMEGFRVDASRLEQVVADVLKSLK